MPWQITDWNASHFLVLEFFLSSFCFLLFSIAIYFLFHNYFILLGFSLGSYFLQFFYQPSLTHQTIYAFPRRFLYLELCVCVLQTSSTYFLRLADFWFFNSFVFGQQMATLIFLLIFLFFFFIFFIPHLDICDCSLCSTLS